MKDSLSVRGRSWVKDISPLMHADFSTRGDLYHPERNPNGHINMGTAENHLVNAEVIAMLQRIQTGMQLEPANIHYEYFYGSIPFRTAIAEHWQEVFFPGRVDRTLTADNIIVGAGCSLALEMLATMLGDPGDVFLIPAPYYSGFIDDIHDRAGIIPVGVHCGSSLSREALEEAYAEQTQAGKRVKAVLFSSPNNPTGIVYEKEAVEGLLRFCMDKDIDLISDEIYAETVFDPAANFISTLQLAPDAYRHRVHATSSFAKDFALSGFRTGFAVSFNEEMLTGMRGLSYYSAVSTHTQALLTQVLQAPEAPAVMQKSREQMREACNLMRDALSEMGIETLPAQGGIFLFANFAPYMETLEFEEEYTLWRAIHGGLKVNISPGQLFCAPSPGWFRICYAHVPAVVQEACRRLRTLKKPAR